ncbi:DUF624 domain-containing protein [Salinicoccus sp. RF5]|nr:DUF624 domain-containing protein [Salinicoccus sp. RF5]
MYNSFIYRILEWIMRLAYVQLLWVVFTLIGLVAFGLFPATFSVFHVVRRWLRGDTDVSISKTFIGHYKAHFFKSNLLGLCVIFGVALIAVNLIFIDVTAPGDLMLIHILLFAVILLYALFLFYLFPAFVHFEGSILKVVRNAFLFMLISPVHTALMAVSLAALGAIFYFLPPLAFIFGMTAYSLTTTWFALMAFNKLNSKAPNS